MSRQCCIKSCSSTGPVPLLITMYPFPKSDEIGDKWMEFITRAGLRWKNRKPGSLVVCSKHFEPSCFENLTMFQMGFATKLFLKSGAIPSIVFNTKEPKDWKPVVSNPPVEQNEDKIKQVKDEEKLLKRTVGIQTNVKIAEFGQTCKPENRDFTQNFESDDKVPVDKLTVVPLRPNAPVASSKKNMMYTVDDVMRYHTRLQLPKPKGFDNKFQDLFNSYRKAFTYTGNGDLYHKSASYEFGYSHKFVVHQKHRKELILSHFHAVQKNWSVRELCKVLSPYFYWPNLIEDFKDWKKEQKPENETPSDVESVDCTVDMEREMSPLTSCEFLENFNLKLKTETKSVSRPQADHDYIADRLTVKRMLCPSNPFKGPPAKIKRNANLPNENSPTNSQNNPLLKTKQLRKTLIGKPQPVSTSLLPVLPKPIPPAPEPAPVSLSILKPRVTPSKFTLIPDPECPYFPFILGIEEVVHRLNGEVPPKKVEPKMCAKCKTDFTPMWHYHLRKVVCEKCWKKTLVKTQAKIQVPLPKANNLPQQIATKFIPQQAFTMHQVGNKRKNQFHLKVLGAKKQMKIVVKKASPTSEVSGSSNKMSLMEAANKIRDHINSRLVMLKKVKPGSEKKIHAIARITSNSSRPANVIMHRRKPPSSEELIRCMQQTQKTNKKM